LILQEGLLFFRKYSVKRATSQFQIPYFVKSSFHVDTESELNYLEKQIEENLRLELKQACFKERNYRNYLSFIFEYNLS
jgi:DnaJ family protein B protein 12